MRPGDVVFNDPSSGKPFYQCRGCDRLLTREQCEEVGGCREGCCDDYICKFCNHVTRVEWPD
jgi:hypothetical protein